MAVSKGIKYPIPPVPVSPTVTPGIPIGEGCESNSRSSFKEEKKEGKTNCRRLTTQTGGHTCPARALVSPPNNGGGGTRCGLIVTFFSLLVASLVSSLIAVLWRCSRRSCRFTEVEFRFLFLRECHRWNLVVSSTIFTPLILPSPFSLSHTNTTVNRLKSEGSVSYRVGGRRPWVKDIEFPPEKCLNMDCHQH